MLFTWKNGASFRNWEAPFFLGVGRGHIRFFGSGYWRFRSYSGSLSKSRNAGPGESNQSALPHHSAPRLGSVCPHSGIAPWARREGPSIAQRGYLGIHAEVPTTQYLRSASVVNGAPEINVHREAA